MSVSVPLSNVEGIMEVCQNFDSENNIKPESVEHTRASTSGDRDRIINELMGSKVFDYVPGRYHRTFKGIQPSVSNVVNKKKLIDWIKEHKKKLIANNILAKVFGHT